MEERGGEGRGARELNVTVSLTCVTCVANKLGRHKITLMIPKNAEDTAPSTPLDRHAARANSSAPCINRLQHSSSAQTDSCGG